MACRDYEYEYENWLQRSNERLAALTLMLRELCAAVRQGGVEIPQHVLDWLVAATPERALSKELFDEAAQMLCLMCRTAEEHSLTLPATVRTWWSEHKMRDEQEELAKGLSPTPIYADFWQEHAAKRELLAEFPGVNHQDAVKALQATGFRVLHQGKHITMEKEGNRLLIARQDPVNSFAMAAIIRRAGLTDESFRELLQRNTTK